MVTLCALLRRCLLPVLVAALAVAPSDATSMAWADEPGQAESPSSSGTANDWEIEGQVIGMNTLAPRPLVQVANLDGTVIVYFTSVEAIVTAGIRYGDYISVIGRKLSEVEFEADTARVDFRGPVSHSEVHHAS